MPLHGIAYDPTHSVSTRLSPYHCSFNKVAALPASALQTHRERDRVKHDTHATQRMHSNNALSHTVRIVSAEFSNAPKPSRPRRQITAGAGRPPPGLGSFSTYSARG